MHSRRAPSVVTIGKFDGVHLGHAHLLRQLVASAHARGWRACVVTFDRHPFEVLRPEHAPPRIISADEKVRRLYAAGVDEVWVCPFTRSLAGLSAEAFLELIRARWELRELWVGRGFALGRDRGGTTDVLQALASEQGWTLRVVPPAVADGEPISSTRIRRLLALGRHTEARQLLGRLDGVELLAQAS